MFRSNGRIEHEQQEISDEILSSIKNKFSKNYFGLPPYSMQQSCDGLAYQCRKPLLHFDEEEDEEVPSKKIENEERLDINIINNVERITLEKTETNFVSQRKVASALLTMVSNPLMIKHFLFKGGLDAVFKLLTCCKLFSLPFFFIFSSKY